MSKYNKAAPTTCANCGTTEGPFVRDRDFPGRPVCGFPPRHRANATQRALRTHQCAARREANLTKSGVPSAEAAVAA